MIVFPVFRSVKFNKPSTHKIVAEEIVEDVKDDGEPPAKTSRVDVIPPKSTETNRKETWNKSIGIISKKPALSNLVKSKSSVQGNGPSNLMTVSAQTYTASSATSTVVSSTDKPVSTQASDNPAGSSLSLLANYSDSGSDSDNQ